MKQTPFLSTKVNVKRLLLLISILVFCPISFLIIVFYSFNSINTLLSDYYTQGFYEKYGIEEESIVYGENVDMTSLDLEDYVYYNDADVFIEGPYEPESYIEANMLINLPEYPVEDGTVITDEWNIGDDNYISIECEEIIQESLEVPPYWPECTAKINDTTVYEDVRSDVVCENYESPSECKLTIQLKFYQDDDLKNSYLFVSKLYTGSVYSIQLIEVNNSSWQYLYFDDEESISVDTLVKGTMNVYLAFIDENKDDFRIVTRFYDASMKSISGIYKEWEVTKGRLLLDKKILSLF